MTVLNFLNPSVFLTQLIQGNLYTPQHSESPFGVGYSFANVKSFSPQYCYILPHYFKHPIQSHLSPSFSHKLLTVHILLKIMKLLIFQLTMHEFKKLVNNCLKEAPVDSQEPGILSNDVHNI